MAIDDDPAELVIRQTEKESEEDSYLPTRLIRLGFSAAAATTAAVLFKEHPFALSIVTTLLANCPRRFEERLMRVVKAFAERLKHIESKIPNREYYKSEEFQSLFMLLAERLHTTHDHEKLKMFGDALGNSGSSDFQTDPREDFVRMLRDLSLADLLELKLYAPRRYKGQDAERGFQMRSKYKNLVNERLSRATRLIGLGLLEEELSEKEQFNFMRFSSQQEAANALANVLRTPPVRSYMLSRFGWRFLQFITGDETSVPNES